jgi:hypothetical protein
LRKIRAGDNSGGPLVHTRLIDYDGDNDLVALPEGDYDIFESWINLTWRARVEAAGKSVIYTEDDKTIAIISLEIPDSDIAAEDLEAWADNEEED